MAPYDVTRHLQRQIITQGTYKKRNSHGNKKPCMALNSKSKKIYIKKE